MLNTASSGKVKPFTSETCLPQKATSQQGHGLKNMSSVLRIGNQKHQAKACLSSKKKVIETFNITELIKVASPVSLTRCVQRETCTQKKKTPVARRLQARPESQKQTEVRAIQFPQPVSPRGPAVQSNKSLAKKALS